MSNSLVSIKHDLADPPIYDIHEHPVNNGSCTGAGDIYYPWDGMRLNRKDLGQWGVGFMSNKHGI
jgi:hypothetical protein